MTSPLALDALDTAKSVLLTPWGVTEQDLQHSLAEILTHHVDYADCIFNILEVGLEP